MRPHEITQPSKLRRTGSCVLLPDPLLTQTSWATCSDQLNEVSFREPSPHNYHSSNQVMPLDMCVTSLDGIPFNTALKCSSNTNAWIREWADEPSFTCIPISFLSLMSSLNRHSIKYDSRKQGSSLLQEAECRLLTWNIKTVNLTSAVVERKHVALKASSLIWTMVAQTLWPHVQLWSKVKWDFYKSFVCSM